VIGLTSYLRAFGRAHTYDVTRNGFIWFGFLVGMIMSILLSVLEMIVSGVGGMSLFAAVGGHPINYLSLAHSGLVGLLFGATGTMKNDLALHNETLIGRLTEQAMTDPLTGLYNRRYILEEIKNMLLRARRSESAVSIVFLDLDNFKGVNERRGHQGGDLALRRVAKALQSVLREGEALGRYGGDEFLLLVSGDLSHDMSIVNRAAEAVRLLTHLSLSAGVATSPEDGTTPEALIATADARLDEVKRERRGEFSPAAR